MYSLTIWVSFLALVSVVHSGLQFVGQRQPCLETPPAGKIQIIDYSNILLQPNQFAGSLNLLAPFTRNFTTKVHVISRLNNVVQDQYQEMRNSCSLLNLLGVESNFVNRILAKSTNLMCIPPITPGNVNMTGVTLNALGLPADDPVGTRYEISITFENGTYYSCIRVMAIKT